MEALNKIKSKHNTKSFRNLYLNFEFIVPDHIFKVLNENKELIDQHFKVNERLVNEHERVVETSGRPVRYGKK